MARTISAMFHDRESAERAAADLETAGFAAAQIDMAPQERPGPTDVAERLKPSSTAITGAVTGALILGTAGWLIGGLFATLLSSTSQSTIGAALVASLGGGIVGWLVGAILATRAPIEEGYYREQRIERGTIRLTVDAAGRDDEVSRIIIRNGARPSFVGNASNRLFGGYDPHTSGRATS